MAVAKDNHIDPNVKARWGFSGTAKEIKVGPKTVGETGGVESARTESDESSARNAGGGSDGSGGAGQKVTVASLKADLDQKGVEYPSNASKAELQALLDEASKTEDGEVSQQ